MDRLIALLAALVGLIALGGALLVHNSATVATQRQATEIAQLKASISILTQQAGGATAAPAAASSAPAGEDDGTADALLALQSRIVTLEQTTKDQAAALEEARTALVNVPTGGGAYTDVASADPPVQSATPAALTADGPTEDCIPLGTRFMAQAGDSFPICKTMAVVSVSGVGEGSAIVEGAGPVTAGGFGNLAAAGCTVMVFTADSSGFAEMRVTCV
jgi:hypothetical protein